MKTTSFIKSLFFSIFFIHVVHAATPIYQSFKANTKTSTKTIYHTPWQRFIKKYLRKTREGLNTVDYAHVQKKDKKMLARYIRSLTELTLKDYNKNEQLAYWLNLYNALTINEVLSHYPIKSIRDISSGLFSYGPWKKKLITINGIMLSLDDIEHNIIHPLWQTPLIHYGLNCASIGCPNLQQKAFTGQTVMKQLEQGATDFINSPRGVLIKDHALYASKIYRWYKTDFGNNEGQIIAHFLKYASPAKAAAIHRIDSIAGYFYDWQLNAWTK